MTTLGTPGPVVAQEAEPLTKAELVRMLSTRTYSPEELAVVVRRSCLTFEPTSRDREDLRSLGASREVMEAVDACVKGPSGETGDEGGRGGARPGEVAVTVWPTDLRLRAGESAPVTLEATRGGRPARGVRLRLRGSPSIEGWDGGLLSVTTDSAGRARLSVPAGHAVRSYRLPIDAEDVGLAREAALEVHVTSGPPRWARVSPSVVVLGEDRDTAATVRMTLADAHGNPVSGVRVLLMDPASGAGLMTDVTGPGGAVDFAIRPQTLPGGGEVHVLAERRLLARLEVLVTASAATDTGPGPEVEREELGRRPLPPSSEGPPGHSISS